MPNNFAIKAKLEAIEGIGPESANQLRAAGVKSLNVLLKQGASRKGRKDLAKSTGFSEKKLLGWINRADLFRIKGVGEEMSDLLEKAGVDTVVELGQRNATALLATLVKVNEAKKLVRKLPTEMQVKAWVKQAKTAKRVIEF